MMEPGSKVWGYEVRAPYDGEQDYFEQNPQVSGMATHDGRIILNPLSKLTPQQFQSVARNEAARLYLREKADSLKLDFDVTPAQKRAFQGTPYAGDPANMRATILARALAGDPSAGELTPQQQQWVEQLRAQLAERE